MGLHCCCGLTDYTRCSSCIIFQNVHLGTRSLPRNQERLHQPRPQTVKANSDWNVWFGQIRSEPSKKSIMSFKKPSTTWLVGFSCTLAPHWTSSSSSASEVGDAICVGTGTSAGDDLLEDDERARFKDWTILLPSEHTWHWKNTTCWCVIPTSEVDSTCFFFWTLLDPWTTCLKILRHGSVSAAILSWSPSQGRWLLLYL